MVFYFREDEEQAWAAALAADTKKAYADYFDKYKNGKYSDLALDKLEELEEKEEWDKVPKNRQASILRYIRENPRSPYVEEAQRLADAFRESTPPIEVKPAVKPPIIIPKLNVPDHMVLVKGGTYQIGDANGESDEEPLHPVTLSDFLTAKYPLTFEEYDAFCEATGRKLPKDSGWGRGKRPAINVSWFDAIDYCNWRSQEEGLSPVYQVNKEQVNPNWQANGYRLPTGAEWEYAARGGQQSQGFIYAGSNNLDEVAWYDDNSGGKTHLVGLKKANELGIYDMSGNVLEWCWDWYAYVPNDTHNPQGPNTGTFRVNRGGSWLFVDICAQVRYRSDMCDDPNDCRNDIGFRLARAALAL